MSGKGYWCPGWQLRLNPDFKVPDGFKLTKEEDMAASIPSDVRERYNKLGDEFDVSDWYNDSLSAEKSTVCAFEPSLHFDCHCLFSFGFIRTEVNNFEFRVLKVTHLGWMEREDTYYYRDDFKDSDFEKIWECLDRDEFWDLMYKGSQFDYLRDKATGSLTECGDVNILDLCESAYTKEHERRARL